MEIDQEEASSRSRGRRKSDSQLTFQSGGTKTELRPDIDVILSLKDVVYKTVMNGYFRRLGGKKNNEGNDAEKEVAREVLHLFKNRKRGETTRFFKPVSRYSSKCYDEVNDHAALEKITADIYRRMESAKRWMKSDDVADGDGFTREGPPALDQDLGESNPDEIPSFDYETGRMLTCPVEATSSARPPAFEPIQRVASNVAPLDRYTKKKKKRKLKKVPQSLPFLSNTNPNIADIIFEEELRNDQAWQPEEVINFFQGLYAHGWGDWEKISNLVRTRSNEEVEKYAIYLEIKFPEVKKFFGSKKLHKIQEKHGAKVKRYGSGSTDYSGAMVQRTVAPQDDSAMLALAASVMGAMKHSTVVKSEPAKPAVVICLGDHVIDTKSKPSLIQLSCNRERSADTLPDFFDPSVRPSVPTNSHQIFIPGNKVHARWLNEDDPGSYGTWYPGVIYASKIAPTKDEHKLTGIPSLLYHVKFEDGAESLDLNTEDIIMQDQYQVWLQDLEHYYSLPGTEKTREKRLMKNTRVFAKWIDPTDPELHGSWISGKIHKSRTSENDGKRRHTYHVYFDNGDRDEDLLDEDVLEEETYQMLLREKMERGRKRSRLSGFDLITEASKIASPITTQTDANGASVGGPTKKMLYSDRTDSSSGDSFVAELRCNEVLESRLPSPTHVARLSNTPSPDVHYGIYMKLKPWRVKNSLGKNTSSGAQDRSQSFTYVSSNRPSQEYPMNCTDVSKSHQEYHTNKKDNSVPQAQLDEAKAVGSSTETKYVNTDQRLSSKSDEEPNTNPTNQVSANYSQEPQVETSNQVTNVKPEQNTTPNLSGTGSASIIATNQPEAANKSMPPRVSHGFTNAAILDVASKAAAVSNTTVNALTDVVNVGAETGNRAPCDMVLS